MNAKQLRTWLFPFHRYVGLAVGLLIVIVGLTGSLLVFQPEIDQFLVRQRFGAIVPQAEMLPVQTLLANVEQAFPDLKLDSIHFQRSPDLPQTVWLQSPDEKWTEALFNPYTGEVVGSRQWETSLLGFALELHYQLLAGDVGTIVVGIVALLLFLLCLSGIMLWPGWRKLVSGFKIKWNAHPKRFNFDLHKVVGITAAVFLGMISFTGFMWNFHEFTDPLVYAVTLTPKPVDPVSTPIPGQVPLSLDELLPKSTAAFPQAKTTYINLPDGPDAAVRIGKKQPQERLHWGMSRVYLDQYTGEVVQLRDSQNPSRPEAVFNAFIAMHYGTFGGILTRILYVFVGLTPLILLITGFVMYRYRHQQKSRLSEPTESIEISRG